MAQPVQAGGFTPDVYADLTRPTSTTQYTANDLIANSGTAASVVPLRFPACRQANGSGVITGAHNQYIRVRLDGEKQSKIYHPTDGIVYKKGGAK